MKYNILVCGGTKEEVEGKPVKELDKYGKFCIHKEDDVWKVDEYASGRAICNAKTRKGAIEKAAETIDRFGIERTKELIQESIAEYGYANKDEVKDE